MVTGASTVHQCWARSSTVAPFALPMQAIIQEDQGVQKALSMIASLTLTPPEHRLLSCFVQDAVDPKAAALYVLQRASRNGKI
jgi:hypothetical protein